MTVPSPYDFPFPDQPMIQIPPREFPPVDEGTENPRYPNLDTQMRVEAVQAALAATGGAHAATIVEYAEIIYRFLINNPEPKVGRNPVDGSGA